MYYIKHINNREGLEMKPTKQALKTYQEVNGEIKDFIKKMMSDGKSFAYAEKLYYAVKKTTYNRYA